MGRSELLAQLGENVHPVQTAILSLGHRPIAKPLGSRPRAGAFAGQAVRNLKADRVDHLVHGA